MSAPPSESTRTESPPGDGKPARPHPGRPWDVRAFGLTDRGRVRAANQDQFLVAVLAPALRVHHSSLPQEKLWYGEPRCHLFAVADGVAGLRGGEEASALALTLAERFLLRRLHRLLRPGGDARKAVAAQLREALRRADAVVRRHGALHPALAGMGTTLTLALALGPDLFVAHVGDSRAYLFRAGKLRRLTEDHTADDGPAGHGVGPAGKPGRSRRRVLANVVGGPDPGVRPEVRLARLRAGDVLLLCTDGLTDLVAEADIAAALAGEPDPRRAAGRLVARANRRGGSDNVTVVAARFEAAAARKG